jgi:hypothetical protein
MWTWKVAGSAPGSPNKCKTHTRQNRTEILPCSCSAVTCLQVVERSSNVPHYRQGPYSSVTCLQVVERSSNVRHGRPLWQMMYQDKMRERVSGDSARFDRPVQGLAGLGFTFRQDDGKGRFYIRNLPMCVLVLIKICDQNFVRGCADTFLG